MNDERQRLRATFELLFATVLFAAIALFGKWIALSAFALCFWRAVFGWVGLLPWSARLGLRFERRDLPLLLLSGVLLTGNWVFYFLAIQVSSVAVAVVALFTFPFFTAVIEPTLFRERHRWPEVVAGLAVMVGVALLQPAGHWGDTVTQGVVFGVLSALCLALRNLLGRRLVGSYEPGSVQSLQFLVVAVCLLPFGAIALPETGPAHFGQLFVLGALLTAPSHVIFLASLRHVSTALASLITSLQPILSVGLAAVVLGEPTTPTTWLGGVVIGLAVALTAVPTRKA